MSLVVGLIAITTAFHFALESVLLKCLCKVRQTLYEFNCGVVIFTVNIFFLRIPSSSLRTLCDYYLTDRKKVFVGDYFSLHSVGNKVMLGHP